MATSIRPASIRIARHLGVFDLGVEGVVLLSERGSAVLQGPLSRSVIMLADGTRDRATLHRHLADEAGVDIAVAASAVRDLLGAGVLDAGGPVPAGATEDDRATGFWHLAGLALDGPVLSGSTADIGLVTVGAVDADGFAAALGGAGLLVHATDLGQNAARSDDLVVVAADDYTNPDLETVARSLDAAGRRWLLARPVGSTLLVGPEFGGSAGEHVDSPCYWCLAHRVRGQRTTEQYLDARLAPDAVPSRATAPLVDTPASRLLGAGLVATAVTAVLAGARTYDATVRSLDCLTLETETHSVRRRPQCAACGDPGMVARRMTAPVVLDGSGIATRSDSGIRSHDPAEMVAAHDDLVSPLTGVVPSLRRLSADGDSVHVYVAGANRAVRTTSLAGLRSGLRAMSSGKGTTDIQARASALGESLERHCGVFSGEEPVHIASFAELQRLGEDAVHPGILQGFSAAQYAERDTWNSVGVGPMAVPAPFDEDCPVAWSPVWSVSDNHQVFVPTAALYYAADVPGASMVVADSNGAAAGTSLEDATLQGLCELIERDAVAQWWYNRLRRPAIDLDSYERPWVQQLRAEHARLGRELWALDLTADLAVPVVVAVSRRKEPWPEGGDDILLSFGAHPEIEIAVARALAEHQQFLPATRGAQSRQPASAGPIGDAVQQHWWHTATVAAHPYVAPDPAQRATIVTSATATSRADPAVGALVADVRERLESTSLRMLVADMTRPDIGLPVVKVIVPGMRHFWPRFGPGRLYDIPVALGRLTQPTAESDLNPEPLCL